MVTISVYSVVGPSHGIISGNSVPGGEDYLFLSLRQLANRNIGTHFKVFLAHHMSHGSLRNDWSQLPKNIEIETHVFGNHNLPLFSITNPVLQHGQLLNALFETQPTSTRYTIVMDPDFFVLQDDLVLKVVKFLEASNCIAAGVPYPARYPKEYGWTYPQVYFSIFDNLAMNLAEIDFCSNTLESNMEDVEFHYLENINKTRVKFLRKILGIGIKKIRSPWLSTIFRSLDYVISGRAMISPRDTGWKLWLDTPQSRVKVMKNVVVDDWPKCFPFNSEAYVKDNPDLKDSGINLAWHLYAHGLIEGRNLSRHSLLWRILTSLNVIHTSTPMTKWPVSSLAPLRDYDVDSLEYRLIRKFSTADFYSFEKELMGFHLGSANKSHMENRLLEVEGALEIWNLRYHDKGNATSEGGYK